MRHVLLVLGFVVLGCGAKSRPTPAANASPAALPVVAAPTPSLRAKVVAPATGPVITAAFVDRAGAPMPEVMVIFTSPVLIGERVFLADDGGRFEVDQLGDGGTYKAVAHVAEGVTVETSFELASGTRVELAFDWPN